MSKCKVCKKDEVYYQNTIIQMFKDLSGKYSMVELFNDYLEREWSYGKEGISIAYLKNETGYELCKHLNRL